MKFIKFEKEKCDKCFKCLRVCPTKAISFKTDERSIIDDICIKCGICQNHCPQEALSIANYKSKVKLAINSTKKVIVSIAPSYVSAFDLKDEGQIVTALKMLGFDSVEETSYGAEIVAAEYDKLIAKGNYDNVITSCCPSANYLIEMNYPELINYMLPVVSPMIAHGRDIKLREDNSFVVFIGPCLAKMAEANEINDAIDGVITFDELYQWFDDNNIILKELESSEFDRYGSPRGKAFPLGAKYHDDKEVDGYLNIRIDGIDRCEAILDELKNDKLNNSIIEINICNGSCINGPEMDNCQRGRFEKEQLLINHMKNNRNKKANYKANPELSLSRDFHNKKTNYSLPNEIQMTSIMSKMGKYTHNDELNCGACGFETCKAKAIAVHRGWSEVKECIAYLREKAESMHAVLTENSPNGLCIVNKYLKLESFNPSFDLMFRRDDRTLKNMPIYTVLNTDLVEETFRTHKGIIGRKIYEKNVNKHFIVNIVYEQSQEVVLCFFTDITALQKNTEELEIVKNETLLKTQEVIDKQMRVAQEIAGLLGETTAETKLSLMSLNDLLMRGD